MVVASWSISQSAYTSPGVWMLGMAEELLDRLQVPGGIQHPLTGGVASFVHVLTRRRALSDDVIVRLPEGWPEPGPFVGREAVMGQWERNREVWDADTLEPIGDLIDAGDRVVVRWIWRGVARGPESHLEFTAVYTMRKGRISYEESFWDHAEALEALGLS
jgi:ketosteroid isomerase-like protein